MKFSRNGYYIEDYVKCACCGQLIYDKQVVSTVERGAKIYCSNWCRDWEATRADRLKRPVTSSDASFEPGKTGAAR